MMGDSAGGTLASSVCHSLRGESTQPIAQVLIYPALGGEFTQGSFTEHSQAPILSRSQINFYKVMRTGTDKGAVKDTGSLPPDFFVPECLPLSDTDFTNLPPTVLISADCDPLRDDSLDYHQKLLGAGCKSHYTNESRSNPRIFTSPPLLEQGEVEFHPYSFLGEYVGFGRIGIFRFSIASSIVIECVLCQIK